MFFLTSFANAYVALELAKMPQVFMSTFHFCTIEIKLRSTSETQSIGRIISLFFRYRDISVSRVRQTIEETSRCFGAYLSFFGCVCISLRVVSRTQIVVSVYFTPSDKLSKEYESCNRQYEIHYSTSNAIPKRKR